MGRWEERGERELLFCGLFLMGPELMCELAQEGI